MAPHAIAEAALGGLRQQLTGDAIAPGDPGYDEARAVFNGMIDRHPAVIAQCETGADVARAIRFGRESDLEIAVRGGGHSVAGMALNDDGIVVDLRRMHTVIVNPVERTARIGGGATMSHLDRACQPYDLATTGGRASTTGVGGFTLGGGSGWLERKFGLACDNLVAVELVTADGGTVHASADENPELFWALHGGGGNFGVATAITLKLHPLPAMSMMMLLFRPEEGLQVARAYRDFLSSAPDELGGGLFYLTGPPEPFVPDHLVGKLTCILLITYAGTEMEARNVAEPLLALPARPNSSPNSRTRSSSACSTTRPDSGTTGRPSIWPASRTRPSTPSPPAPGPCPSPPARSTSCSRWAVPWPRVPATTPALAHGAVGGAPLRDLGESGGRRTSRRVGP